MTKELKMFSYGAIKNYILLCILMVIFYKKIKL